MADLYLKSIRDHFDMKAPQWAGKQLHDPSKIEIILEAAQVYEGEKILDCGCGTGPLVPYLAERVGITGVVTAVDFSPGMIQVVRNQFGAYPNVEFFCQDAYDFLENKIGEYGSIICLASMPHFPDKPKILRLMYDALVINGNLTIAHTMSRDKINGHHRHHSAVSEDKVLSLEEMSGILQDTGFSISTAKDSDSDDIYLLVATKH